MAQTAAHSETQFIPIAEPDLQGNELAYVTDCVRSGWISSNGGYVARFEAEFARWCHAEHAISTMNGTVALHLALHALGIGPGDEVIVPTLTFIATANAVRYCGATPILADSEYDTWNLDPVDTERRVTSRTRAILPVHLFGQPAKMAELLAVARRHNLLVVEDAAESHGALANGKHVGTIGEAGIFSFFGNKIMTTGEGGIVTTNDSALAHRLAMLRDHGMIPGRRYWHEELGFNYRMTNLQAAIGVAQVERVDWLVERKRQIADFYRQRLRDLPGLTMPPEPPWARNVYWMFTMLVDQREFGVDRDELMVRLRERGIDSRAFFYSMHTMPIYQSETRLPVAEDLSRRGIMLPSSVGLGEKQLERIATAIEVIHHSARTG